MALSATRPSGLAVYIVNRPLAAFGGKEAKALPNWNQFSHTFVFVTDPTTGKVINTYSWGNDFKEEKSKNNNYWFEGPTDGDLTDKDMKAARDAIQHKIDQSGNVNGGPRGLGANIGNMAVELAKKIQDLAFGRGLKVLGDEYNSAIAIAFSLLQNDPNSGSGHAWGLPPGIKLAEIPFGTGEIDVEIISGWVRTCKEEARKLIALTEVIHDLMLKYKTEINPGATDYAAEVYAKTMGSQYLAEHEWDGFRFIKKLVNP